MSGQKPVFTVFTPTYNRAHKLGRVFDSLKGQTFRRFEWVVVDDGSNDGTEKLVAQWAKEADFPVSYTWQPNSGKHVAINRGVKLAQGELFIILDSDDWLAPTALERFLHHWESIPDKARHGYAGVAGLCADTSGRIIGTQFPAAVVDSNSVEIRTRYRVKGDNFGMNRTDILRAFPFPENLGGFVTEALVWNRIAREYRIRYVNEVLAYKEYQPGGLSDRSVELRARSCAAARTYYREFVELEGLYVPVADRLKACANYVRFSCHGGVPLGRQFAETKRKIYWLLSLPVGCAACLRDKRVLARRLHGGKSR